MSIFSDIAGGFLIGEEQYKHAMADVQAMQDADEEARRKAFGFGIEERHFCSKGFSAEECHLCCSDNIDYMKWLLLNGYRNCIKVIYIDPPFFTKANYNATVSIRDENGKKQNVHHLAYNDMFERDLEFYIANMTSRLMLMKELLHPEGLIWVHLDWHSSHYIRVIMDEIFGEKHFVNEIIWKYKSGGSGKKHFARKHDSLLVYSKTNKYKLEVPKEKSYNRNMKPYHFKGVSEYKDEYGWYTLVNMKDVWSIDMVGRTSAERTGYATQKPIELVSRIVLASTDENDICADFFCGSGALIEAAATNGRRWLGCDNEQLAVSIARKRLDMRESDYVFLSNRDELRRVGRLSMNLKVRDRLENGKSLLTFEVSGFEPELDIGHIPLKERAEVRRIAEADGMRLLDYIMIDPAYNGAFSAEHIISEGFDEIRFISKGNFAVIAVDVFGREYFMKVDLDND